VALNFNLDYLAMFVAASLHFIFGLLCLLRTGGKRPTKLQLAAAFAAALVHTFVLAEAFDFTQVQTIAQGVGIAALLWVGFSLPGWITEWRNDTRPTGQIALSLAASLVGTLAAAVTLLLFPQ